LYGGGGRVRKTWTAKVGRDGRIGGAIVMLVVVVMVVAAMFGGHVSLRMRRDSSHYRDFCVFAGRIDVVKRWLLLRGWR
jgi:hypothetical protein